MNMKITAEKVYKPFAFYSHHLHTAHIPTHTNLICVALYND